MGEQREQLFLQSLALRIRAAQERQNWGHDEALLRLPHVFRGSGQFESMLDQVRAADPARSRSLPPR